MDRCSVESAQGECVELIETWKQMARQHGRIRQSRSTSGQGKPRTTWPSAFRYCRIPELGKWIGFDFQCADWVAPRGKGPYSDVLLRFSAMERLADGTKRGVDAFDGVGLPSICARSFVRLTDAPSI